MILEKIEYSSKENLVKLTISGEFFYISYDFYNSLNIKKDDEIDFDIYKDILAEDNYNRCKSYALKQISYSFRTSFDLKKKLLKKDFDKDVIDKVLVFLKSYDLIDDTAYVRSYVNDKSNISLWSKGKIKYNLKSKFIDDKLIDKYLDLISYEDEYEKAYNLALKRKDLGHDKNKIYRFLAYRLFSYDIIKNVLDDIFV